MTLMRMLTSRKKARNSKSSELSPKPAKNTEGKPWDPYQEYIEAQAGANAGKKKR